MTALHPQPRPQLRIHWRTPITMVILLMILIGGAWWGWNSLSDSSAGPTCVEQQLENNRLVPKQVSVNVYNGGAKGGTAAAVAELLKKRGFHVAKIANEPNGNKVDTLEVRGHAANSPELQLVAGQTAQKPVPVADGRDSHTVDLVVGTKYTKLNAKGMASIAVPAGSSVCLPTIYTPQPVPKGQNPN